MILFSFWLVVKMIQGKIGLINVNETGVNAR